MLFSPVRSKRTRQLSCEQLSLLPPLWHSRSRLIAAKQTSNAMLGGCVVDGCTRLTWHPCHLLSVCWWHSSVEPHIPNSPLDMLLPPHVACLTQPTPFPCLVPTTGFHTSCQHPCQPLLTQSPWSAQCVSVQPAGFHTQQHPFNHVCSWMQHAWLCTSFSLTLTD